MTVALTVTDSANGGGFSAAVTGSPGGATNTLYAQRITDAAGSGGVGNWFAAGSRTGDGAITGTLAAGPGYYWWHLSVSTGDLCPVVYQPLTGGLDSLHDRIVDAVEARARLLDLEDLAEIYVREKPVVAACMFPCLVLTTFGKAETEPGHTNQQDDTGYAVYAVFVDREANNVLANRKRRLRRQRLRRAFRDQRLPGVAEVMTCVVEPDPVVTIDAVRGEDGVVYEYGVSALLLRFVAREVRGLGA